MPRKRQSTKSRIVKSAWNLFYKNGYDDTTVEDIITASKTSKGTFYHYFKSKEGLLNTLSYLFDEKYEELYNVVDPNLSSYDKLLWLNHKFCGISDSSRSSVGSYRIASERNIRHQDIRIPVCEES